MQYFSPELLNAWSTSALKYCMYTYNTVAHAVIITFEIFLVTPNLRLMDGLVIYSLIAKLIFDLLKILFVRALA